MHIGSISFRSLDSSLIESLFRADAYPHPVQSIEMIETHISWVMLTGQYAYKIKKPIELGFLDFRELASRLFYCEEEVRLNRRWAPEIYIDVVPIVMRGNQAFVGGDGPAVEYAVRMYQFAQEQRLDVELTANSLTAGDMDELAQSIAQRHLAANVISIDEHEKKLAQTRNDMWDNLDALEGALSEKKLRSLRQWTVDELNKLEPAMRDRLHAGYIRECHGDLHLSNLVRLPRGINAFDCIEFSPGLRNIDVLCDISFLVMDLVSRRRPDLAYRFLNRYFEVTGDYGSMQLFTLYFVYRCLVRAKVAAIRSQERQSDGRASEDLSLMQAYCDMALQRCRERKPTLVTMHGLSGSGKTWLSSRLVSATSAIRIRSDIERKRMFGIAETSGSGSGVGMGIYSKAATEKLYRQLHGLASTILRAGHTVILDAAYLNYSDRESAHRLAANCGAYFVILDVNTPVCVLRERIANREGVSEANLDVLDHQMKNFEPLKPEEKVDTIHWDTGSNAGIPQLLRMLSRRQGPARHLSAVAS